jgi:excisionase family DNA binding protein
MATDVMTVEELAAYLKVNPQTVYRKFRRGDLPGVRIGRAIRFKRDVVDGWLRAMSYQWDAARRDELRRWAGEYARKRSITERQAIAAVRRRRSARR